MIYWFTIGQNIYIGEISVLGLSSLFMSESFGPKRMYCGPYITFKVRTQKQQPHFKMLLS